jgi:hypothetical protein
MGLLTKILTAAVQVVPVVVPAVETLFHAQAKSGPAKAQAALTMAQTAIATALDMAPSSFGPAEKALILAVNQAVVNYYNAKGWPVPPA